MKSYRLSAYQRQRFQLIEMVPKFAEEERFAADDYRLVPALGRTQHHQASGSGASFPFLKREQLAGVEQVRNRVKGAGAVHCFVRAQRSIGENRKSAVEK